MQVSWNFYIAESCIFVCLFSKARSAGEGETIDWFYYGLEINQWDT